MKKIKLALCQMLNVINKENNISKAQKMIKKAANKGADIVILPEIFNCPYHHSYFRDYAEKYPEGTTIKMLSSTAKENGVYVVGGSIPEIDDNNILYNTCFTFDRNGNLIGKHRKVHLFDINIKDGIKFQESKVFKSGSSTTIFDTEFGKLGTAICYDIRFPELIRLMALEGAKIIIVPAAFNMTTGPAHWETLFKCRALDNQVFMVGASPARNINSSYTAYGNSLVANPWGQIICRMDEKEGIEICEINLDFIDEIREQLPLLKHRRTDFYTLKKL